MMSKYLIGLIPSIFILIIACFAKAAPVEEFVMTTTSSIVPEPTVMFLFGLGLLVLANGIRRRKR